MMIIVNPGSGGGTALAKWNRIAGMVATPGSSIHFLDGTRQTRAAIAAALLQGEREFIAGGGDGTVNTLLNHLLTLATDEMRREIRLGAIALGSSNDFHKPSTLAIDGIPVAIDFAGASLRDVGCVTVKTNSGVLTRYFAVNASIGLVAEANQLFNQPDVILRGLKKRTTDLAILYTALRTIRSYSNIPVEYVDERNGRRYTSLTQLSVLKNMNFSGSLHWSGDSKYHDGLLQFRSAEDMGMVDRLQLLHRCSHGRGESMRRVRSWSGRSLTVSSARPFTVEYDGEIIHTSRARFSILPRYIMVCAS